LDVDVAGRAARVVGSEQHAAFEHQSVGVRGSGEPREEAFECVELMQFVGRTLLSAGQVLQIQVGAALDGGPSGSPAGGGHSRISSVERSAGSAFGNARAIARSVVGCVPGWRSHRRSASTAVSVPAM
jgi:hypothetical protein